jgi:phosphatidylglycerol lysyltransferase
VAIFLSQFRLWNGQQPVVRLRRYTLIIHERLGAGVYKTPAPAPDPFLQKDSRRMNKQSPLADVDPKDIHQPEVELLRLYGGHTLSFFGLAPKNRHFLAPGGTGLVNYQLMRKVAVVLGDPVCAPEAREQTTRSFLDFCALHRWRVAFYQTSPERLAVYRSLRLRTFKMGEEAILYPQTFTLQGSALANVRTSCRRAEREGVRIQWYEGVPPLEGMQHIEDISKAWLGQKAGKQATERGFGMGRVDELTESAERAEMIAAVSTPAPVLPRATPRLLTAVATMDTGQPCAFVTFTPIYGCLASEATVAGRPSEMQGWGWTLDLMRRGRNAPPGVMELLLVRAMERFCLGGAHRVSLGLVALADSRREMTVAGQALASFVTDRMALLGPSRTLFAFKQKFDPCWESRYLVASSRLAFPKIALAVLRLRHYSGSGLVRLLTRWFTRLTDDSLSSSKERG